MNEPNTVIVLSDEQSMSEQLQSGLNGFTVLNAENVEALNEQARAAKKTSAFVLSIRDSDDWMAFEFVKTAYPSVPCFICLEDGDGYEEAKESAMRQGAMAVFPEHNTTPLSALIKGAASNNLRGGDQLDHNADFLSVYGDISRELGRLQNEFTETSLRTLPQPFIGDDTKTRLRNNLVKLREIIITP